MRFFRPCLMLAAALAPALHAQVITPKTVPVQQADQFDVLPSSRGGMANIWIALDDSLLDPFVNPAKATRHRTGSFFALPFVHSISGDRGGGRTVPIGGIFAGGQWSGAASVALQQINRARVGWGTPISQRSATNQYATGVLARRFGNGISVGAGISLAGIGAVDGVDLMYAGSDTIRQNGSMSDLRLGLTKNWEQGQVLEFVVLHNRSSMVHDVHTTTWGWDSTRRIWGPQRAAWERNADQTNIWGVHSEYVRPIGTDGWRMGYQVTANRLSHPKIPNFSLMNMPRDPGKTNAFNLGAGVGRTAGATTVGMDVVYEPIFSETWADAERDTVIAGGGTIPRGARTVENTFRFANSRIRLGLSHNFRNRPTSLSSLQFGLALGSIRYRLKQSNNVQRTNRMQDEEWMEWAPTFGYRYASNEIEILYNMRITCLSGSTCGLNFMASGDDVSVSPPVPVSGGGVIVAPASPLTFDGGRAMIHRFMVRLPIR